MKSDQVVTTENDKPIAPDEQPESRAGEFEDNGKYEPGFFHMWVNTDEDITVLNNLPANQQQPEWISSFLHEYIHFIQDITTTHGLLNLSHAVEHLRNAVKQVRDSNLEKFPIPLTISNSFNWETNKQLKAIYTGQSSPSMPPKKGVNYLEYSFTTEYITDSNGNLIPAKKFKLHYEDKGAEQRMGIHFGSIHIKEYMAHALQCQLDPKVRHDIFPYSIVELIIQKEVPRLAEREEFMIALCDASLMIYHPAELFFDTLARMKCDSEWSPTNVESVYEFVFENFKSNTGVGQADQSIEDLFKDTALMAKAHFGNCLKDNYFRDNVAWFEHLITQATEWRFKKRGFITRFVASPGTFSQIFTDVTNSFGIPFTTNAKNRGFFAPPAKLSDSKISPAFPKVFQAISKTFCGSPYCSMHPICKQCDADKCNSSGAENTDGALPSSLGREPLTDASCLNKPWERIGLKEGCPYTSLWRTWGLEAKIPILKGANLESQKASTHGAESQIIPKGLKGGVLLLGSLYWEGGEEEPRGVWRKNHLEAERYPVTCLPLRYGRKSGTAARVGRPATGRGGEFTMVLWPGEWQGKVKGTAKWSKFISEFAVDGKVMALAGRLAFEREVEALARAEGIWKDEERGDNGRIRERNWSHVSKNERRDTNIPWGLVALWVNPSLPEENPIKDIWTNAFKIPTDKDLTPFGGIVDKQGIITLEWPRELDELDFVLCTPTLPTLDDASWSAELIATASINGTTHYFEHTTKAGISTADDSEIWKQREAIQNKP